MPFRALSPGARLEFGSHGPVQPLAATEDYAVTNVLTQLSPQRPKFIHLCLKPSIKIGVSVVIARDTAAVAANGAEDHTTTTKRPVTPSKRWRIGFSRRRVAVSRLVKSGSRRTTDGFDATKVTVLFPCRAGMRQRIIAAMIKTACRRVVCDRQ
ncbi:hypothetical protein ACVSQB_41975 [Bradyrhizobium elkanii]